MATVQELLSVKASSVKAPTRFPAATYEVTITGYRLLPFHWKKSNTYGLAYVPTVKPTRCIDAEDDTNPEIAAEIQAKLAEYGEWMNKEFSFAYMDSNVSPPQPTATIAPINFPLIETDADGNKIGLMDNMMWRFYLCEDNVQSGFAVDVLNLDVTPDTELFEIVEKTVGASFLAQFEYEPRHNDPSKTDLRITTVSSIG